MWAKLDDSLLDHRKIFDAGELIGRNGPAVALGFYVAGILYAGKHLTDGFLPASVVRHLRYADKPMAVADAMVQAELWEPRDGGFQIHDYHDHNPQACEVKEKRKQDLTRKQKGGRNSRGTDGEL